MISEQPVDNSDGANRVSQEHIAFTTHFSENLEVQASTTPEGTAVTTITAVVFALVVSFFGLVPNENSTSLRTFLLWLAVAFNIILYFGYFIFFWMTSGQTPGKGLMGVRVISIDGRPLTFF